SSIATVLVTSRGDSGKRSRSTRSSSRAPRSTGTASKDGRSAVARGKTRRGGGRSSSRIGSSSGAGAGGTGRATKSVSSAVSASGSGGGGRGGGVEAAQPPNMTHRSATGTLFIAARRARTYRPTQGGQEAWTPVDSRRFRGSNGSR